MGAKRAIVIGGGIGGVTATVALRRMGIDAVAFERARDVREIQVGAGVFMWTNALRALEQIGLREAVQSAGSEITRMELRSALSGRMLLDWDVGGMSEEFGAPTVGIARPDLHDALLSGLEPDGLVLGAECVRIEQDADGVTAVLADGREERADVLIGADGQNSMVRRQVVGPAEKQPAGYLAWRGIVQEPMPVLPKGVSLMLFGRGASLFVYRVGRERPYWLAFTRTEDGDSGPKDKEALVDVFRDWYGPGAKLIDATPAEAVNKLEVGQLWTGKWAHGRVLLIGDAAHLFSPNLGQGACQAIEDGVAVAKLLRDHDDVPSTLQLFERQRKPRVHSIYRRASVLGKVRRWKSPFFCTMRDFMLRLVLHRIETWFHRRDVSHVV